MREIFLLVAAFLLIMQAQAQVKLSDFFVDLNSEEPANAIYATNQGTETLYLKIQIAEVLNPGEPEPELRHHPDPRELGLLVSPQRLVLQPGEENRIRLVALAKPSVDKFYKVTVVPVTGDLSTDAEVGVKIMVGYSAWAWIRPEGAEPIITAKRHGTKLILSNRGGTLAQMMLGKQCAGSVCETIEPFRVLAGKQKTLNLPLGNAPVTFKMVWGVRSRELSY